MHRLVVDIAAWIFVGGRYDPFAIGDRKKFALEFYSFDSLTRSCSSPFLNRLQGTEYEACAKVTFASEKLWVLDFGAVSAYREGPAPSNLDVGSSVSGKIQLGIDPFSYVEVLHKEAGVPPLIYAWRVARIELVTAPKLYDQNECWWCPDMTRAEYTPVETTAKRVKNTVGWDLYCNLLDASPTHNGGIMA